LRCPIRPPEFQRRQAPGSAWAEAVKGPEPGPPVAGSVATAPDGRPAPLGGPELPAEEAVAEVVASPGAAVPLGFEAAAAGAG
jgi:hypothetical protein